MAKEEEQREEIGLPPRLFLYSFDQIAAMLQVKEAYVKNVLAFYENRSPGLRPKGKILARNIAPEGATPVWRVSERELLRFLRYRGFNPHYREF